MSSSSELIKRRERVVSAGVGRVSGMTAASASGATIIDADGRECIDFGGGIGVMNVGHCDAGVVEAIRRQAGELLHACIHVATYEPYVALCEKLVELLPHGGPTKAMLVNTGAEAVENAIKIARQATGRSGVICFTGAFHGRTLLCATLTSKVDYKKGCGPFVSDVYRLPYPRREPEEEMSEVEVADRELARLRQAMKDTAAPGSIAAVIIELVQGEGGFHVAPRRYVEGLRELCDAHGIVLIFDEVQSGFGRTGAWGAFEHFGVIPDLSTWAKSMGGGLPISSVVGKASIMDRAAPGTLGGTFGGNPVSCAAALATIRAMETGGMLERARTIGQAIRARLEGAAQRIPAITDVRGLGAMMAIELHEDGDVSKPGADIVKGVVETCLAQGLVVLPAGVLGNVIRVLCPLAITDAQLVRGLGILEKALERHALPEAGSRMSASSQRG